MGLGVNECEIVLRAMAEFDLDCTLLAGRYTLLEQASLSPLLDLCALRGNAIVIGGPFNSGVLAGNGKFNYADAPAEILAASGAARRRLPPNSRCRCRRRPAVSACASGRGVLHSRRPGPGAAAAEPRTGSRTPIPDALWTALQDAGLIDARAPVPQGAA